MEVLNGGAGSWRHYPKCIVVNLHGGNAMMKNGHRQGHGSSLFGGMPILGHFAARFCNAGSARGEVAGSVFAAAGSFFCPRVIAHERTICRGGQDCRVQAQNAKDEKGCSYYSHGSFNSVTPTSVKNIPSNFEKNPS